MGVDLGFREARNQSSVNPLRHHRPCLPSPHPRTQAGGNFAVREPCGDWPEERIPRRLDEAASAPGNTRQGPYARLVTLLVPEGFGAPKPTREKWRLERFCGGP